MTNKEVVARLTVALQTFQMADDSQLKYHTEGTDATRATRTNSVYDDGDNIKKIGSYYSSERSEQSVAIYYHPLVAIYSDQLVVGRVVGSDRESTAYWYYSFNFGLYVELTISEVIELFSSQPMPGIYLASLEEATTWVVDAARKLDLVGAF